MRLFTYWWIAKILAFLILNFHKVVMDKYFRRKQMEILFYLLFICICSKYFDVLRSNPILLGIREINKVYKEIFTDKNIINRITQSVLIILSEFSALISLYLIFTKYIGSYIVVNLNYYIQCGIITIVFLLLHYFIGYILLLSTNFHKYLCKNVEESIKANFLLSYFLSSIFLVLLLLVPNKLSTYVIAGIISISISYISNMGILYKLMKNPNCIKINEKDKASFGRVLVAAVIIIFMLIINLFLLVCLVNMIKNNSFSNNPSNFELFYYTVLTFTTIGFGDIVPLTNSAKLVAIVISFTSVICISIFLGFIYSNRKK